ncbi:MAG: LEA type 2 family protein [Myxococcaceae bacterium]|nr:LEA type 2 family protein [Myxococcaceae bacterium]
MPRRLLPLVAAVAVFSSGCAFLKQFLATAFQRPSFNFKNLGLTDISLGGLTLDTIWELRNPNNIGISLASVEYALAVEQKQVIAGAPPQGLQIAPNSASDLHFPANVRFQDLVAVVETFLNKDSASYQASGAIGVNTPIGVIRLPLATEGQFEVPKVPLVQFGNPRVTNVSFSGATVEFPLAVTNRNTYALPITGVSGALSLAGANIGTLSTGDLGNMEGRGVKNVSLPLTVNFLQAASAATVIARGGNAQVAFNAQVQSGGLGLPVNVNQLVNLLK